MRFTVLWQPSKETGTREIVNAHAVLEEVNTLHPR
jgi:hypothetical protein